MAESIDREPGQRASRRRWAVWLLVPVALMTLAVPFLFDSSLKQATSPDVGPIAGVDYQGRSWEPSGAAVSIPDRAMTRVGTSQDGRPLFVARAVERRGGGGGAGVPARLVYVRIGQGAYQPLAPR